MSRRAGAELFNEFCPIFFSHSHTVIFSNNALYECAVCTTVVNTFLNDPCKLLTNNHTSSFGGDWYYRGKKLIPLGLKRPLKLK